MITKPAYGFAVHVEQIGPFPTHTDLMRYVGRHAAVAGSPSVERAATPETNLWHEIWPVVIR